MTLDQAAKLFLMARGRSDVTPETKKDDYDALVKLLLLAVEAAKNYEQKFLYMLCAYYRTDRIAPGLQLAWLPDKKTYYVAVHRFLTPYIESRAVIAKGLDPDLYQAIDKCRKAWTTIINDTDPGFNTNEYFPPTSDLHSS